MVPAFDHCDLTQCATPWRRSESVPASSPAPGTMISAILDLYGVLLNAHFIAVLDESGTIPSSPRPDAGLSSSCRPGPLPGRDRGRWTIPSHARPPCDGTPYRVSSSSITGSSIGTGLDGPFRVGFQDHDRRLSSAWSRWIEDLHGRHAWTGSNVDSLPSASSPLAYHGYLVKRIRGHNWIGVYEIRRAHRPPLVYGRCRARHEMRQGSKRLSDMMPGCPILMSQ